MALDQERKSGGSAQTDTAPKGEHHDPRHAARLQRLIARARAYHARHADWVREFNGLTHGQCGDGGEGISYRLLRSWQAEHHLPVDGLLGPATIAAAREHGADTKEHAPERAAHGGNPSKAANRAETPDPEVKEIVAEEHHTAHDPPPQTPAHGESPTEHRPPAPTVVATPTAAVAPSGDGHALRPTEAREVKPAELETTAEAKGAHDHAMAHADAGYRKVYKVGDAQLLVFLPAQGIVPPKVDVFLFFHGMFADFATHEKDNFKDENPAIGADLANAVTKSARNVIAIVPMQWPGFAKGDSYRKIVDQTLINVGSDLGAAAPLQLGNVSVSGHSLGGAALGKASTDLMDETTDVTLQDAGYGGDHFAASFEQVRDWMLLGKGPKTLRLITQDVVGRGERNTEKSAKGLNEASFRARIGELQKAKKLNRQLTVSCESFGQPPKTFSGAFLELRVDVTGPDGKQGTMYVMREHGTHQGGLKHFDIRDQSMEENIRAGGEAGFGIHNGHQDGQTPLPQNPAADAKHHDAKPRPTSTAAAQTTPTAPAPQHVKHADPAESPHAEHQPKKPTAPAQPTEKKVDQHTKPADAAGTPRTATDKKPEPIAAVAVDVSDLQKAVAELHDPKATAAATDLAALVELSRQMQTEATAKKQADLQHEVKATGRIDFLKKIGEVHAEVAALSGGADAQKLAAVKGRMFRTIQEVSPYHSQFRNVDILEADGPNAEHRVKGSTTVRTRTCNLTSLAMALEGLGKGAHTYQGSQAKVLAIAKVFQPELKKAELEGAGGPGWEAMTALRLPDFLELAAIAHFVKGNDAPESAIWSAAETAWKEVMDQGFLETFATEFGAKAHVRWFRFDATAEKLNKNGDDSPYKESNALAGSANHQQRGSVDKLIDARNLLDAAKASGKDKAIEKAQTAYDALKKSLHVALEGDSIEKKIPIEDYKKAIIDQIGAELNEGAAVQTVVTAHYVRVHAIEADHIVIDDPGQQSRAHKNVRFEEARAQGMFARRLVLR